MTFEMWIAAGIVGVVVALGAWWLLRRQRTSYEASRGEQEQTHTVLLESKNAEIQYRDEQNQRTLAHNRAVQQDLMESLEAAHTEDLERLRAWSARGMQWEEASRKQLIRACRTLGVNGFVATNVCFMVQHARTSYMHQSDHLVVAEDMLFVVEAKNWRGTIFHRKRVEENKEPFSIDALPMVADVEPGDPYVVKVDDDGSMLWRPNGKRKPEPVKQVQTQSLNFRDYVTATIGHAPGMIFNCVLYSHEDATLVGGLRKLSEYTWVTHANELSKALGELQQHRKTANNYSVDVAELHELISSLGADIVGVGKYAQQWESPFPIEREV